MTSERTSIEVLADKASKKESFLGSVLSAVALGSQKSMSDIASRIKCPAESLSLLSLCKMPRDSADHFAGDIRKISEYSGCNAAELANLVREYQAIRAMREFDPNGTSHGTMLMAARDKKPNSQADDDPRE